MRTEIPVLDELLAAHAEALGDDFAAYRNHTYRVANFCAALTADAPGVIEKIAVAAAFHDIGIWTDDTFDYLEPSVKRAETYLRESDQAERTAEIGAMILEHHKLSPYRLHPEWLVEPFRKADLVDVSMGLVRFGLARAYLREVFAAFPNAGFHKRLVQLASRRLMTHPWNPMPMMRL